MTGAGAADDHIGTVSDDSKPDRAAAPPARRFSDREAAVILRRAVELQEKAGGSGSGTAITDSRGLTLEQLRQVAAEVGVDPRYVTAAAESGGQQARGGRLLGGPISIQHLQVLPGRTDPAHMQAIIDEIRRVTGQHGKITQVADSIEWFGKDAMGGSFVSVSSVGNETRIRAMGNRTEGALLVYTLAGTAALFGAMLAGDLLGPFGVEAVIPGVSAVIGGAYLSARAIWSRHVRKWDQRLRGMVGAVAGIVESEDPSS